MKNFIEKYFSIISFFIIALVVIGLYSKSITFDWQFLDDDVLILAKQDYLKLSNIGTIFTDTFFGVPGDTGYRPLLNVSFAIDRSISGLNPISYHISNILIFLLAIFSIYLLFSYKNNKIWSLFFSLIIAVNPLLCAIVCRPVDRSDSLLTLFAVLSFYFLLRFVEENNKKILFSVLHLFFFTAALFTKEVALVLPIIFFIFSRFRLLYIIHYTLYIVIVLVYLALRSVALTGTPQPDAISFYIYHIANNFIVIIKYFYNILFPITDKLTIVQDISFFVLMLAVFTIIFIKTKYNNIKLIFFTLGSFILLLLPTMVMGNHMHSYAQNRIFLPMVCIYYLLLNCLQKYKINVNKVIIVIMICILLGYAQTTFFKMDRYQNRWTAFIGELKDTPNSPYINAKFAMLLADIAMYDKAEQYMKKAINIEPYNIMHYENLALIYYKKGDIDKANELTEFAEKLKVAFAELEGQNNNV